MSGVVEAGPRCPVERPTRACRPRPLGHVRIEARSLRTGATAVSGASIVRQGYVASAGQYLLYPAVQPDAAGNAAMIFALTSTKRFPSAAYATLGSAASRFGSPVVAAAGTGPYDRKATRWGDYSFAVPDDSSDSAWLATEYMPPRSSQTTTGQRNWGTRVIEVPLR